MSDIEQIIYKMLLIRRVEEEIISRYAKQKIRCPVHLSIGQEAIAVGACHNLRSKDKVFSTHRCHAHYLAKGGSLDKMVLELHGKVGGCMDGRGGSMHLSDKEVNVLSIPIVASAIPLAVGSVLADKLDGNGNVTVCFFGDAAMEEGVFHESLNFASLMKLPIIFVCENNQYSVDTHIRKRQPERYMISLARAHGIIAYHKSGNNVFEVADMFKVFIDQARNNEPMFIILDTQRSHVHCGIDKEFDLKFDPLEVVMNKDRRKAHELIPVIDRDIKSAFDAAESAPLPTPDMAARFVYA